jgi:hypothetical protein
MSEEAISELIRRKLSRGDLPATWPKMTWGGKSSGLETVCAACDVPIPEGDVLIEVNYPGGSLRSFHPICANLIAAICGAL